MKTIYYNYMVKYEFSLSVWSNESILVVSNNEENAKKKAYEEISGAYGTDFCEDLKILSVKKITLVKHY